MPAARQHGLTLLEMLVTLLLFAAISALLWQTLATLGQVEQRLADTQAFRADAALRAYWVRQALAGLMNGPQGDPVVFAGTSDGLRGYVGQPPWPGAAGPTVLELRLTRADDRTGLIAREAVERPPGSPEPPEWRLWDWPGAEGRFDYLDETDRWHERWPPAQLTDSPRLPRAVRLTGPPDGAVLIAITAGDNTLLRLKDLESSL